MHQIEGNVDDMEGFCPEAVWPYCGFLVALVEAREGIGPAILIEAPR
jgi:hypothetical protein